MDFFGRGKRVFKGGPSKTRKGRLDFTTKKGNMDFQRNGHRIRRMRTPYNFM